MYYHQEYLLTKFGSLSFSSQFITTIGISQVYNNLPFEEKKLSSITFVEVEEDPELPVLAEKAQLTAFQASES